MQAKDERAKEKLTSLFIWKHLQEKSPQKQFAGCAAQNQSAGMPFEGPLPLFPRKKRHGIAAAPFL